MESEVLKVSFTGFIRDAAEDIKIIIRRYPIEKPKSERRARSTNGISYSTE